MKPLTPDELPPLSNPPTRQEAFNRAYLGLKSQDFTRCLFNGFGGCAMVDDAGRHCAIGWIDPTLPAEAVTPKELRDALGRDFLDRLMSAHDNSYYTMDARLHEVAKVFDLTIPGATNV
jgi:hypothetical protein